MLSEDTFPGRIPSTN